jgi:hypothetical protein
VVVGMKRHKREEWPSLVARWEASGLKAAEFASQLGVDVGTLGRWKRSVAPDTVRSRRPSLAKIVEIRADGPTADDEFEVRLGGGRSVGVPASFDPKALERLLQVLGAAT